MCVLTISLSEGSKQFSREKHFTITVAEFCTGGMLSLMLKQFQFNDNNIWIWQGLTSHLTHILGHNDNKRFNLGKHSANTALIINND